MKVPPVLPALFTMSEFNSWILLTIPCFIYIMFKIFINREEYLMEKEFGQDYVEYRSKTSAVFPKIWKYEK